MCAKCQKKHQKFSGPVQVVVTSLFFCLERHLHKNLAKLNLTSNLQCLALLTLPASPTTSIYRKMSTKTSAFRRYSGKESSDNQPRPKKFRFEKLPVSKWTDLRQWTGGLTNKVAAGSWEEGFLGPQRGCNPFYTHLPKKNGKSIHNSQHKLPASNSVL